MNHAGWKLWSGNALSMIRRVTNHLSRKPVIVWEYDSDGEGSGKIACEWKLLIVNFTFRTAPVFSGLVAALMVYMVVNHLIVAAFSYVLQSQFVAVWRVWYQHTSPNCAPNYTEHIKLSFAVVILSQASCSVIETIHKLSLFLCIWPHCLDCFTRLPVP